MHIAELVRHARHLVRVEFLIAEIRFRARLRQMTLAGIALTLALLAIVLINIGVYEWLKLAWGPVWTPLGLAVADIVLAGVMALVAARISPGPELAVAEELRKTVTDDIESELKSLTDVGGLLRGSQDWRAATLLIPAITSIVRALRARKSPKESA